MLFSTERVKTLSLSGYRETELNRPSMINRLAVKKWPLVAVVVTIAGAVFVSWDVYTPNEVRWESALLNGHHVLRAPQLIVQHQSRDEVWATIGYSIYRGREGEDFEKFTTIRPRFGLAWLGYSRTLRSWSGYLELTEVVPFSPNFLVVFAGGDIYRVDRTTKAQHRVHRLRYFGKGKGRGVLPHGIARDGDGSIYYGEYTTLLSTSHDVRLYRSVDQGQTWQVAFVFKPGEVRHIHTVRWDPIDNAIWIGTGDTDSQSRIGYSHDGGSHFEWIGQDSQIFRTVNLLFFDNTVVWATDTETAESQRALSWNRQENRIDVGEQTLPAPAYYAQKLNDFTGIVTLAETATSVWAIDFKSHLWKLFEWPVRTEKRRGPHPAVRVPRGLVVDSQWTYLNPLRTSMEDAVIYRIPTSLLLSGIPDRENISTGAVGH